MVNESYAYVEGLVEYDRKNSFVRRITGVPGRQPLFAVQVWGDINPFSSAIWFTDGKKKFLIGDPTDHQYNFNMHEDGTCEVEELSPDCKGYNTITPACRAIIDAAIAEWVSNLESTTH